MTWHASTRLEAFSALAPASIQITITAPFSTRLSLVAAEEAMGWTALKIDGGLK